MVDTSSSLVLLNPHNYHTWKTAMQCLLRSKGFWSYLNTTQPIFQSTYQTLQHQNKMDEAMGMIFLSVEESLQFHLDECSTPQEMWDKFHALFGIGNKFRALQIEAELTSLAPNAFSSIEGFLMKFKQQ